MKITRKKIRSIIKEMLINEGVLTVQQVPYGGVSIEADGEPIGVGKMIRALLDAGDDDIFYAPQGVSPESLEKLLKQDKENAQGAIENWDASVFADYYNVDIDRVIKLYARRNNHSVEEIEYNEEW